MDKKTFKLEIDLETAERIWDHVASLEKELWDLLETPLLKSIMDEMRSPSASYDDLDSCYEDIPPF
jgi:hypothetical protein